MKNIFTFRIPFFYLLILIGITIYSTFLITSSYYNIQKSLLTESLAEANFNAGTCEYQTKRLGGYNYIKPLLYVDKSCETGVFIPVKQEIIAMIEQFKVQGKLTTASVYLRDFNKGDFISINENTTYKLGSLMKVPLLITYLHIDEDNGGTLENELLCTHTNKTLGFEDDTNHLLTVGKKYKIRDLLEFMMINGDYDAANLLIENIDVNLLKKTFTDLGIPAPDKLSMNYTISANDYSLFMRTLYNATYLTINNSEYATELMSKASKAEVTEMGLPINARTSHKKGEFISASEKQLHETAIIYVNNYPYLITIMTKGSDINNLKKVISEISALVYKKIVTKSSNS
jgi:beta-lactamase class A